MRLRRRLRQLRRPRQHHPASLLRRPPFITRLQHLRIHPRIRSPLLPFPPTRRQHARPHALRLHPRHHPSNNLRSHLPTRQRKHPQLIATPQQAVIHPRPFRQHHHRIPYLLRTHPPHQRPRKPPLSSLPKRHTRRLPLIRRRVIQNPLKLPQIKLRLLQIPRNLCQQFRNHRPLRIIQIPHRFLHRQPEHFLPQTVRHRRRKPRILPVRQPRRKRFPQLPRITSLNPVRRTRRIPLLPRDQRRLHLRPGLRIVIMIVLRKLQPVRLPVHQLERIRP